jgi:hypothetical protein
MNLFLADGVGNLRDPRVGNIMTLDRLIPEFIAATMFEDGFDH